MPDPTPDTIRLLATGLLLIGLLTIAVIDLRSFRIPDWASLPLIGTGLCLSFLLTEAVPSQAALGAVLGFGSFALIGSIYFERTGADGLGLGDAKLLAGAGAWLGAATLPALVAIASVSALAYALLTRSSRIAFGPWLAGAFWILWLRQSFF